MAFCLFQVKQIQKKLQKVQKDGEIMLRTFMKKYPVLQPYARKPYTTYLFRALVTIPIITFIGPVLSLAGVLTSKLHLLLS